MSANRPYLLSALLISLLFSTACSETSSSTADPDKEKDQETQVEEVDRISLTGLAIKGLVRGAKIEVFALEDNGVFSTTAIGSGASDNQGEYQLLLSEEVSDYTGPVKVVLSHLPEASIQCDDPNGCGNGINAGDFYPMPMDFSLVAIAELTSGVLSAAGDSVINLTALTTLASRFIENDTISEDSIERGNNQVRSVLALPSTVDLTTTRATNIVDDESSGNKFYGAINAAFQRIANNSGQSLTEVLDDYAQDFADGQIVYKSAGDSPTFKTLIDATIDLGELDGEDLTKAQGIQANVDAQANDVETNIMPPAIELGNNRHVETNSNVTITATTVSGTPTSFSWQVIAGPEVFAPIIDSPNNSVSFTSPTIGGEISIRVIAKDAMGLSDNDIITINIMEPINTDISGSGAYHGMLSQRGIAAGAGSALWRELFVDTDFAGGQNWNLVINNDGSGSMNITSGNSLRHGIWGGLEIPNTLSNINSEARNDIEPGGSFPFVQTASGNVIINIPAEERIDDQEPRAQVTNQRDFEILKFAEGSYFGRNLDKELEFSVENDQIQFNHLLSQRNNVMNLLFSKKSPIDNFSTLNGKQFVGMEHSFNLKPDGMSIAVTRFDLTFNDALGNITMGNEDGFQLAGLINSPNTAANNNSAMIISPVSHPDETFNIGPIAQGLIDFSDAQGKFQLAINPDQTAILGVYNDWANSDGSNEFTTSAIEYREAGLSAYFRRPAAPVQLDGKTFQVQSLSYYYQQAQNPVSAEEIAGRLIVKRGIGSIKFEAANAIFNLTEEQFVYRYPNDDLSQSAELITVSQPNTISRSLLSPSETGEDGCFFFPELSNSLFCTNGQSMLMRENDDAAGASGLDKFLTLFTGSAL
jgi:hypothetical protein